MNYKRGFRRIALLIGIPWVTGWLTLSGWYATRLQTIEAKIVSAAAATTAPQNSDAWFEQFTQVAGSDTIYMAKTYTDRRNTAALFAVVPPFTMWLTLLAGAWIFRGFRRDSQIGSV
jgi:hypothetical protein